MAKQSIPRLLAEIAPHSVQLLLTDASGRLVGYTSCAADAASLASAIGSLPAAAKTARAQVLLVPSDGYVTRATADEATAMRTPKTLVARAESAASGLGAPLSVVAFDGATGKRVETVGSAPWVLAAVANARLDEAKALLSGAGLEVERVQLALPVQVGALVAALQDMPESTRALLWQVGETDARLACVSSAGCEAAWVAPIGFAQIFECVQAGLGLKFKSAAAKLFFNSDYDFSETAGPIAERVAALLRPVIAAAGCKPTALHVVGLPAGQQWLAKAVASALEVSPLAPDMAEVCTQLRLGGGAIGELPPVALGLVLQAAAPDEDAWQPQWLDAAAPAVVPAPAPRMVAPSVAPKPAPAPVVAAVPEPVSVAATAPAPSPAVPLKAAKAASAPKATPAARPQEPAPAPVVAAAPEPVAPAPESTPEPEPVVVEQAAVEEPELEQAEVGTVEVAPAKKKTGMLFAVLGVAVVLGAVGGFLATRKGGGDSAAPRVAPEQTAAQEAQRARWIAEEMSSPRSFRNERYSLEVSERGVIEKIVGVGNRTLVDQLGWIDLQGTFTGSVRTFNAGSMSDADYVATVNKTIKGDHVVFEITGKHSRFAFTTTVTCLPRSLAIRTEFQPIRLDDPRGPISGVYTTVFNRASLSLGQRATIVGDTATFSTLSGPAAVKFNADVWAQSGEAGKQAVATGSNLMFFYFTGSAGAKNVLNAELMLP